MQEEHMVDTIMNVTGKKMLCTPFSVSDDNCT